MDDLALARALHGAAIVHWIGGLWLVSLVVLADRAPSEAVLARFLAFERRFAPQARLSILLAGASGLWLTARLDLWWRFAEPAFWWMHGMVGLWLLFILFCCSWPNPSSCIVDSIGSPPASRTARCASLAAAIWLSRSSPRS
jgi:hypothetical protein